MCAQRPLEEAKNDPCHPLYYHAKQIHINQDFASALHTMFSQYDILIKFFDQQHTWQVFIFEKFLPKIKRFLPPSYLSNETIQILSNLIRPSTLTFLFAH